MAPLPVLPPGLQPYGYLPPGNGFNTQGLGSLGTFQPPVVGDAMRFPQFTSGATSPYPGPSSIGPINNSIISRPAINPGPLGSTYGPAYNGAVVSEAESIAAQVAKAGGIRGSVTSSLSDALASVSGPKGTRLAGGLKTAAIPLIGSYASREIGKTVGGTPGALIAGVGQGASMGSIAGPWGAAAGGLLGGALALSGRAKKGTSINGVKAVAELINSAPITDEERGQLGFYYKALKAQINPDTKKKYTDDEAVSATASMTNQLIVEKQQQAAIQTRALSAQAMYADFFKPLNQQMMDSAQMRFQTMQQQLPNLPESYRGVAAQQNQASLDNAIRTTNAYAAQSAIIPQLDALKYQQGLQNQAAQQMAAQALSSQLGGSVSPQSLQAMLAASK